MKRYLSIAMLAFTMFATTAAVAVLPQSATAAPAPAAVVQAAPEFAPAVEAAPPSVQWSYYCTYTVYWGYGGGVSGSCSLDRTYMNWWAYCYLPGYGYFYVNSGWFGPYGGWNFWAFCGSNAYLVNWGYSYSYF
jgi:hypothetical protein